MNTIKSKLNRRGLVVRFIEIIKLYFLQYAPYNYEYYNYQQVSKNFNCKNFKVTENWNFLYNYIISYYYSPTTTTAG